MMQEDSNPDFFTRLKEHSEHWRMPGARSWFCGNTVMRMGMVMMMMMRWWWWWWRDLTSPKGKQWQSPQWPKQSMLTCKDPRLLLTPPELLVEAKAGCRIDLGLRVWGFEELAFGLKECRLIGGMPQVCPPFLPLNALLACSCKKCAWLSHTLEHMNHSSVSKLVRTPGIPSKLRW